MGVGYYGSPFARFGEKWYGYNDRYTTTPARDYITTEMKTLVSKEETFDQLEIRVGRIIEIQEAHNAPKKAYVLKIDFGKFGIKTSVGRFTHHSQEELRNKLILAVLNFESRKIGDYNSEVLVLGVQYPKADSGEATFITPMMDAKIGGKLF